MIRCELRVAIRTTSCELVFTSCKLHFIKIKSRVTSCKLHFKTSKSRVEKIRVRVENQKCESEIKSKNSNFVTKKCCFIDFLLLLQCDEDDF